MGAKQRDRYSWVSESDECYVYTAEIDHIDKENNEYKHNEGIFEKYVPPLTKEQGHAALSIRHAQELYDAVSDSYNTNIKCRLLLVKGTKYGAIQGNIKAAADGDYWQVTKLNGSVTHGFSFTLERVE